MNSWESFCTPGKGVSQEKLSVEFGTKYFRKNHPHYDKFIDDVWSEKIKENIYLFDKSKFRYHGYEISKSSEGKITNVKLYLGVTSYKDFIGTNYSPKNSEIMKAGVSDHNASQAYLSDPLGVGALVETADLQYVFLRRSQTCAEAQGKICRAGGHPEPDEVIDNADRSLDKVDDSLIVKEIYGSVLKEIRDEVNIPIDKLGEPLLLGIGFNPETCNRPSLEFYVKCSLTSTEIERKYRQQTQIEKDESTDILFVPRETMFEVEKSKEKSNFWNELTHSAKCAISLFAIFARN